LRRCEVTLAWDPDSPPTGKTFEMSKNNCEFTRFRF
jgi:hypothetical protein